MLLVAGIDPGTTVGWALLDLEGNLVVSGFQKAFSLDSLVAKLHGFGHIILVGCDKAKVPSFVYGFATKVGAKIFSPRHDLSVSEKRAVTKRYNVKNPHELDALASALFALKNILPLTKKVFSALEKRDKLVLFDKVFDIVFSEEVSIQTALLIAEPEVVEKSASSSFEKGVKEKDVLQLYHALRRSRKELGSLRSKNKKLTEKLSALARDFALLKARSARLVKPKPAVVIAGEKEARIRVLSSKLDKLEIEVSKLRTLVSSLESFLLRSDVFAVKHLKNFSFIDVGRFSWKDGDVVFVDDPNEFSDKAVSILRNKGVAVVLFSKKPSQKVKSRLPFIFISGEGLVVECFDSVVVVDKNKFDRTVSCSTFLEKLVNEYKKERSG